MLLGRFVDPQPSSRWALRLAVDAATPRGDKGERPRYKIVAARTLVPDNAPINSRFSITPYCEKACIVEVNGPARYAKGRHARSFHETWYFDLSLQMAQGTHKSAFFGSTETGI